MVCMCDVHVPCNYGIIPVCGMWGEDDSPLRTTPWQRLGGSLGGTAPVGILQGSGHHSMALPAEWGKWQLFSSQRLLVDPSWASDETGSWEPMQKPWLEDRTCT